MSEQGPVGPDLPGDFDQARMDHSIEREVELDAENWPELDDHFDLSEVYPSPGGTLEESVNREVSGSKREEYSREVHGDLSHLEDERELDFDEEFSRASHPSIDARNRELRDEFHELAESELTRDEIEELINRGESNLDQALEDRHRDVDRDDGPAH